MTVYDNPILMLLAFVILAVAFSAVLKHFKVISVLALVVIAAGSAIFGVLYVSLRLLSEHLAYRRNLYVALLGGAPPRKREA